MKDKRRESRIDSDLPISVTLREGFSGPVLVGPAPARVADISSLGASLIVPQIRFGNHHLFYSSRDHHPSQVLFIQAELEEGGLAIPVRPIGFDRVLCDQTMPFHMGVEFMAQADDGQIAQLIELAQERHQEQKSWWQNFLQKIWPSNDSSETDHNT
jgi:hypothetical protein